MTVKNEFIPARVGRIISYSEVTGRPRTCEGTSETKDVWDFIEDCFKEGFYKYIDGEVYRMYEFRGKGRWLDNPVKIGCKDGKGYITATVRFNGEYKRVLVHRMIYAAFNGVEDMRDKNKSINHKNGIKSDNRIDNLELVTHKENIKHAWETGLATSETHGNSKLNCEKVKEIRRRYKEEEVSQEELAKEFGVKQANISKVVLRQTWRRC